MKRFQVLVAAPAEAEIEEAYLYIRQDSPANAIRWRLGLIDVAESLRTLPRCCPLAPENALLAIEIRQLLYGTYRMLFTVQGDTVVILHVRHGARQWMKPEEIVPPQGS